MTGSPWAPRNPTPDPPTPKGVSLRKIPRRRIVRFVDAPLPGKPHEPIPGQLEMFDDRQEAS